MTATAAEREALYEAIRALGHALDRTQANFVRAVNGRSVRDMDETLAENHAAAGMAAKCGVPMPQALMRGDR